MIQKAATRRRLLSFPTCAHYNTQTNIIQYDATDGCVAIYRNVLTITFQYAMMFTAEHKFCTFLQMRNMYCFVEYKMLLFNPTLQKNIGDDIIYIIS